MIEFLCTELINYIKHNIEHKIEDKQSKLCMVKESIFCENSRNTLKENMYMKSKVKILILEKLLKILKQIFKNVCNFLKKLIYIFFACLIDLLNLLKWLGFITKLINFIG